jgi:hypothetical protein
VNVTAEANPQEIVKSDEMIHVGVGNKNVADFEKLPGIQPVNIAQIKKQGRAAVFKFNIDTGIAEGIVNETGSEHVLSNPRLNLTFTRLSILFLRQINMSNLVMPDLIRHPVFSVDSGFRRNDGNLDILLPEQ